MRIITIVCPHCGKRINIKVQLEKSYNYIIKEFNYICNCCNFFYQYGSVSNENIMSWQKSEYYSEIIQAIKDKLRIELEELI